VFLFGGRKEEEREKGVFNFFFRDVFLFCVIFVLKEKNPKATSCSDSEEREIERGRER
jgi:glutathione S-transferase